MQDVRLKVNAKINFSLHVGAREETYHPIQSVVGSVNIGDVVCVSPRYDKGVFVRMNAHKVTEKNTALRAAKAVVRKYGVTGADIYLHKTIPFMGGMGGSSADCAGVLRAMAEAYRIPMDAEYLAIGDEIGKDVRYMLTGGYAELSGYGSTVTPFVGKPLDLVMIKPRGGLSAARVYEKFDEAPVRTENRNELLKEGIREGNVDKIALGIENGLQPAAFCLMPQLQELMTFLKTTFPEKAWMTGSGSCLFLLCASAERAKEVTEALRQKNIYAKYCKTRPHGIERMDKKS